MKGIARKGLEAPQYTVDEQIIFISHIPHAYHRAGLAKDYLLRGFSYQQTLRATRRMYEFYQDQRIDHSAVGVNEL